PRSSSPNALSNRSRPFSRNKGRPILDAGAWQRRKCRNSPGATPNREGIGIVSIGSLPLSRFTVLDLTHARAGPTAVRQLADWGAKVIKIEPPAGLDEGEGPGGPRDGSDFQNVHRNKRGITLNLKSPDGVAILKKLAAKADVLVENYRPDVKDRLGIGYEA